MRIDGKALAEAILADLALQVKQLRCTPTLAVILIGNNPESLSYIRQKQKATEKIGGRLIFEKLPKTTLSKELAARVAMYNRDTSVHGLIIQRPLPDGLSATVDLKKDIDGLTQNSPFDVPVAMAVFTILNHIGITIKNKKVVIVGRGETAGKPIAAALAKQQCATSIIHSQTPDPAEITKQADIIISCVGKEKVITPAAIKPGVILVSVGLTRGGDGKLHGDYEEEDIKNIASFYTPTPGGVGPLNIASLMQNLVLAAQK
jgi:methylenetetrahydrofolate dehydrogenase (NADP+)/methenyltetrahydrofolate cyclohydrolase